MHMSAKRALIVDDSRSARAFLSRILERYKLQVDSAASAEEALEYLTHARPDVIFMDHLMPGMDGFQALTAIKNDPRTATIPIMMYTSQEGELYLSQARALGALGVLPKQTKPADVRVALEQLHLLGEALPPLPGDSGEHSVLTSEVPALAALAAAAANYAAPTVGAAVNAGAPGGVGLSAEARSLIESMLHEHAQEMRRVMSLGMDKHSKRVVAELRAALAAQGGPAADAAITQDTPALSLRNGRGVLWLSAAAAALAMLVGAMWLGSWWRGSRMSARLPAAIELPARIPLRSPITTPALAVPPLPVVAALAAAMWVDAVPIGESPLAGARTEHVQVALDKLLADGFHGVVEIRSFPGRYCLQGAGDAQVLASAELNYARCDQIGNPLDPAGPAARESVAFANMLAALHTRSAGALDVQVSAGAADEVSVAYPIVSEQLTAGEWNRAAAANNRIEMRWHAAP
jgi:CheY-like chemotaxis protein